jgi:hypothetical protein
MGHGFPHFQSYKRWITKRKRMMKYPYDSRMGFCNHEKKMDDYKFVFAFMIYALSMKTTLI